MAKILYTPIGQPSQKKSGERLRRRPSAHIYIGSAKVPGNQVLKYASLALNALLLFAAGLCWYLHR